MNPKHPLFLALSLSIALHLLFFGAAFYWDLPSSKLLLEESQKMFSIKSMVPEIQRSSEQETIQKFVDKIKFQNPERPGDKLTKKMLKKIDLAIAPSELPQLIKQDEIFKQNAIEKLKNDVSALKQNNEISKRKVNRATNKEIDVLKSWDEFLKETTGGVEIPEALLEDLIAFKPTSIRSNDNVLSGPVEANFSANFSGRVGEESNFDIVDELLGVELVIYKDPKDGQGYFQISIAPLSGGNLFKPLKKEIIFLVDTSLSINAKRLNYFKRGINYSLENLNEGDQFNILSFKEDINSFAPSSVLATPENIKEALSFISKMRASQRTDLYQAFLDSLKGEASLHPSYFILVSDGRPNSGITSPVQIISEITEINARKRPIFAFGGGERVNTFLLDFVAFQNRGWAEYSKDERHISQSFKNFYDKIKNPILTDIRFRLSGLDETQVYPKHLPDFYQNTAFVLYGTFQNEEEFSMQILGEHGDQTKELIFKRLFNEAKQGSSEISKKWAMNKLYHLVSQITLYGYSPEILEEIRHLGEKYKIRTPYNF